MMDMDKYCQYLYHSFYIPIYLYENKILVACYPAQENGTLPPSHYLSSLWESDRTVTYTITSFYSYYGCIQIENSSSCIVIGPINNLSYSKDPLFIMRKEFAVKASDIERFHTFFHSIPLVNPYAFINTLLFINYTINGIELKKNDIVHDNNHSEDTTIDRTYTEKAYLSKEDGFPYISQEIGNEMMRYIETGNYSALQKFPFNHGNMVIGSLAHDKIRHLKNLFIATVTMAANAATKGGLTPNIAYQLTQIYIQQVERLTGPDAITSLIKQSALDFTKRVADTIMPANTDAVLRQVIQYVRSTTNRKITVSDAAEHVGLSRSYLSSKFRKETGFELSGFIRQCKLEEAKDLLAFSDKSISEISNYLFFASQSHFQRAFKNHFGFTPQAYRKSI